MAEKLNESKLEFIYLHGILSNCKQMLFKSYILIWQKKLKMEFEL